MFGFRKNQETVVVVDRNSTNLSAEIDLLTSSFTSLIDKLKTKSEEARTLREAKEQEIKTMQMECDNLSSVETRANTLAEKISNIFN